MKILNWTNLARLLLIILSLVIALVLNSCMTYRKAKAKYAHTYTDTVRISKEVILKIPKDSVQYRFITDTIPFYDEIRQGRATVKVSYKDRIVKIKADCDSATVSETVTLKAPQEINNWGVNPNYEKGFFVLCGLFLFSVFHIFITNKNNKKQ